MSNISGALSAVQGVNSVLGGISQANATNQQGEYTQRQFETEAQLSELQSQESGIQGTIALEAQGQRAAREMGQARASFAGQGVTSTSGSVRDAEGEISRIDNLNASTLKHEIWQKQFGYSFQSMEAIQQGAIARIAAKTNATSQMTSGILGALNYGVKAGEYFHEGSKANVPGGDVSMDQRGQGVL